MNLLSFGVYIALSVGVARSNIIGFDLSKRAQVPATNNDPFTSISPSRTLKWNPCYEHSAASKIGDVSCARLLAPLDFANTSSGNVQLAIIRLKGSRTGGAVFYNPGGPGDDPVEDILTNAPLLRAYIGNDSDIITVVPREVGATFPPITCDATDFAATQRNWEISNTLPGYGPGSLEESYAIGESLGLDCSSVTPHLIPYVGTVAVAHDMESVRKALGQDKLSYLGFSYGTALGGTYAALFPDRVGRMVLDGVLDLNDWYSPTKDPNFDIGDADLALDFFFQSCHVAGPDACPIWPQTTSKIRSRFLQADQQIFHAPLPVTGYGLLKWPLWRSGVYNALYSPARGFALLAGGTSEILKGSAGPYIEAYMELVQGSLLSAEKTPADPKNGLKNSPNGGTVISCSDGGALAHRLDSDQLSATFSKYQQVSEYFGGISVQYVFTCDGAKLSAKARLTTKVENISTANPILYIGNTADPTTPIRNAHRMSAAFSGSRVLTVNGTGHLSFNAAQNTKCVNKWTVQYFRDGTLPPEGTVCEGKQKPFA